MSRTRSGERVMPAFQGWPHTRPYRTKQGDWGYRMNTRVLTPLRAKLKDALGVATSFGLFGGAVYYLWPRMSGGQLFLWCCLAACAAAAAYPVVTFSWELIVRRRLKISYDNERLKRHRLWPTRVYDADHIQGFGAIEHPKAREEYFKHEFKTARAAARGEVIRFKRIYQESALLVMRYCHENRTMIPIYRIVWAQAIGERLGAIQTTLDEQAASRRVDDDGPSTHWSDSVNHLP